MQLEPPARVSLMPSLDDIQGCINKSAQAILGCFKQVAGRVVDILCLRWMEAKELPMAVTLPKVLQIVETQPKILRISSLE